MIINDTYRFCFIHIPKCGGTSVRSKLQVFDETDGFFTEKVSKHDSLGYLDYVHIPLGILKEFFPAEFYKVQKYRSFAVIRDPYKRFSSSVSQHLKRYRGKHIKDLGLKEYRYYVQSIINDLNKNRNSKLLSHEYIHFQPQVDYIFLDGCRIIEKVYLLENIDKMFVDININVFGSAKINACKSNLLKENKSFVYKNNIIKFFVSPFYNGLSYILKDYISIEFKNELKKTLFNNNPDIFDEVTNSKEVRAFIEEYYFADLNFYNSQLDALNGK